MPNQESRSRSISEPTESSRMAVQVEAVERDPLVSAGPARACEFHIRSTRMGPRTASAVCKHIWGFRPCGDLHWYGMALWPLRCAACQWPVRRTYRFQHRGITLRPRKFASTAGRLPAQRISVGCGTVTRGIRNTTTKLAIFAVCRRLLPRLLPTNGRVSWPRSTSGAMSHGRHHDQTGRHIRLKPLEGGCWRGARWCRLVGVPCAGPGG